MSQNGSQSKGKKTDNKKAETLFHVKGIARIGDDQPVGYARLDKCRSINLVDGSGVKLNVYGTEEGDVYIQANASIPPTVVPPITTVPNQSVRYAFFLGGTDGPDVYGFSEPISVGGQVEIVNDLEITPNADYTEFTSGVTGLLTVLASLQVNSDFGEAPYPYNTFAFTVNGTIAAQSVTRSLNGTVVVSAPLQVQAGDVISVIALRDDTIIDTNVVVTLEPALAIPAFNRIRFYLLPSAQ
jgi:hypothetical protein